MSLEQYIVRELKQDIKYLIKKVGELESKLEEARPTKKLEAEVGNLKVQNADYSQIVGELSKKIENYEKLYGTVFKPSRD